MCVVAINHEIVKIVHELVQAQSEDLKQLIRNEELTTGGFKSIYGIRKNLPYWLKSYETDIIETKCYFLSDCTDLVELKKFLEDGRVYIDKQHSILYEFQ